jgi:hypothetical protein
MAGLRPPGSLLTATTTVPPYSGPSAKAVKNRTDIAKYMPGM